MHESTLRRKAQAINYSIRKGLQHCRDTVLRDPDGKGHTGYMVMDLSSGFYEWGCYDADFDYLWTIDDVENFIRKKYQELGIEW